MDILLLFIIAVLLGFLLLDFEKSMEFQRILTPLRYVPRKNSIMDKDSDMYALYYTDTLYPVYGREIIRTIQYAYRYCSHQAFDLGHGLRHVSEENKKAKEIEYLIKEMNRILLQKNLTLMMQANLDVLNGKITIQEARRATLDTFDINNAVIPPLASRQIAIDVHAGVSHSMSEYVDHHFLVNEERKRASVN